MKEVICKQTFGKDGLTLGKGYKIIESTINNNSRYFKRPKGSYVWSDYYLITNDFGVTMEYHCDYFKSLQETREEKLIELEI
jgi:hypothetical protein